MRTTLRTTTLRTLPRIAIAIVALALSASLTFAGQPAASSGLNTASTHAGKTVPVKASSDGSGADEDTGTEPDESTDDSGDSGDNGSADANTNCTTDPTTLTADQLAAMTHGSIVCWAAHQTTWDTTTYPTKGAFVSHWARMNHGADASSKSHGHGNSSH